MACIWDWKPSGFFQSYALGLYGGVRDWLPGIFLVVSRLLFFLFFQSSLNWIFLFLFRSLNMWTVHDLTSSGIKLLNVFLEIRWVVHDGNKWSSCQNFDNQTDNQYFQQYLLPERRDWWLLSSTVVTSETKGPNNRNWFYSDIILVTQ
jgi:hypothetical protein